MLRVHRRSLSIPSEHNEVQGNVSVYCVCPESVAMVLQEARYVQASNVVNVQRFRAVLCK